MWLGETPKNVAAVFRAAREENAVLFFDEADAIASRRSSSVEHGVQREMNTVVNVLLQEMERFNGVVIFATNLASNFDPAFERRIRTHVLFEMPGVNERERIWQVQFARETPLAADVNFGTLARTYEVSGGDIRNAVLKAALAAAAEPGDDAAKRITHRHLNDAMREVLDGKRVMRQSILRDAGVAPGPLDALGNVEERLQRLLAIAAVLGGSALIVAIVALVVALLR
jgi:SpoVK/Ycf46/Vps4 family AAA+-type ATPase